MKNSICSLGIVVCLVSWFLLLQPQALPAQQPDTTRKPAGAPAAPAATEPQAASQDVSARAQMVPALPVPRLVKFGGAMKDASGQPRTGVVGMTFSIYKDQEGGATLWMETHNVELDDQGRYSVLLGNRESEGMPLELFASGEPRWLGVKVELPGELEQARVLLVSVPYALKAVDAETLGGKPASAYALAAAAGDAGTTGPPGERSATGAGTKPTKSTNKAVGNATTAGFIPVFTDNAGTVGNSVLIQSGSAIGIGQSPVQTLDVNGGVRGTGLATGSRNTAPDAINTGSLFLGGSNAMGLIGTNTAGFAAGALFRKASFFAGGVERMTVDGTTGNVGINNTTPGMRLDVAGGSVRTDSQFISTVATGTPPLSVASTTLVPNLNAGMLGGNGASAFAQLSGNNTFTTNQVINAPADGGPGLEVAGPDIWGSSIGITNTTSGQEWRMNVQGTTFQITKLTGATFTPFRLFANSFDNALVVTAVGVSIGGSVNIAGDLALPNTSSASVGVITLGGTPFLHNFPGNASNTFVGASAGNLSLAGASNTAVGAAALGSDTTGGANSAFGPSALFSNTTGNGNSAFGAGALATNTTGGGNAAFGGDALFFNTSGSFNIAIGTGALQNETGGSSNIAIGHTAGSSLGSGSNNIYIGSDSGTISESNTIRIGDPAVQTATFLAGTIMGNLSGSATGFTGNLAGEVTGTQGATVVSNAVAANSMNAIVRRDGSGNFAAGTITANLSGNATTATIATTATTATMATSFTGNLAGEVTGTQGATVVSNAKTANTANAIVRRDASGSFSAGTLTLAGNLALPNTTSATTGVLTLGGTPFLHNFGGLNTFAGASAGNLTMTGTQNSAFGVSALQSNAAANSNSAFGAFALFSNSMGAFNSAFGEGALGNNTTGSDNSAFGREALLNTTGNDNSAFGFKALTSLNGGTSNIAVGSLAGSNYGGSESNNIDLGNQGVAAESNTIHIGNASHAATFIAAISGKTSAGGIAVLVNGSGQLGTTPSSRRFKHLIADMGAESDLLMKLRPVAFYYKPELDESQTRQYGLVAEEVAQFAPQLVVYDKDGKPETVRYHFVNAMLLNEVQKQRNTIERQQAEIEGLAARLARLEALVAAKP